MNADEKQTIYNLLRTASQNIYGYTTPAFKNEKYIEPEKPAVTQAIPAIQEAPAPQAAPAPQTTQPVPSEHQAQAISVTPAPAPVAQTTNSPSSSTEASGGMSMGTLILKLARCTHCALARTRNTVIPGIGIKEPDVLVIGDHPSAEDDKAGLPFVGPAGQLLDKMLGAIRLERNKNCYLTTAVKCIPPHNRGPYPEETEACSGFLEAQIKILKPKLIICTGRVAAVTVLKNNQNVNLSQGVDMLRGKWFDYNGIPVLVTFSPEDVMRNQNLKKPVWDDLRLFAARLKEISPSYAALFNA